MAILIPFFLKRAGPPYWSPTLKKKKKDKKQFCSSEYQV